MSKYYILKSNGTLETFENYLSTAVENDLLMIITETKKLFIPVKEIALHGDEKYWTNILEVISIIDRIVKRKVSNVTPKAVLAGYLYGYLDRP